LKKAKNLQEKPKDRWLYLGCDKGQVIVLDLNEHEITHTFARYQVAKVDEVIDDLHELAEHKIFISVFLPNFIFTLWNFDKGKTATLQQVAMFRPLKSVVIHDRTILLGFECGDT
jgi:hypothetical protein